jgi:hypothetical protein
MATTIGGMLAKKKDFKQNNKKTFFFFTLSYQNHIVGLNLTLKDVGYSCCYRAY